MARLLMCRPEHFDVSYVINPWMVGEVGQVNKKLAEKQWESLFMELSHFAKIDLIEQVSGLPDMVFTANAGLVHKNIFFPSNFRHDQRKGEEEHFTKFFADKNYEIRKLTNWFEGEGDFLSSRIDPNFYFAGSGFRSLLNALPLVSSLDENFYQYFSLFLVDYRFYHLDTCFCPINKTTALFYPRAFAEESIALIKFFYPNAIEVSEKDALAFACNAIVLDRHVFLPYNNDVSTILEEKGFVVHEFDVSEFLKAGGGPKCLCLTID